MTHQITPMTKNDQNPIMNIFNHYIEQTFAAYPETPLPHTAFDILLQMSKGFPTGTIKDEKGGCLGFGMLRPHSPIPAFSKTAEISYFLHPDATGKGLGKMLLAYLEKGALEMGIITILASISSLNPGSIRFHQKNGFVQCGCFQQIGIKKGKPFDTVWMQKIVHPEPEITRFDRNP